MLSVAQSSPGVYRALVQADFTCKGITLPLTLPVTASYYPGLAEERTNGKYWGDILVLRTKFSVSRKKLGISEGIPDSMVGDAVQVGVALVGLHYAPGQKKPEAAKPEAAKPEAAKPEQKQPEPTRPQATRSRWKMEVEQRDDPTNVDKAMLRNSRIRMSVLLALLPGITRTQAQVPHDTARAQMDQPVELNLSLPEVRTDQKVESLNLAEKQAGNNLVLFFFSEQCGVTFRYKQRLQRLQKDFEGKGFTFVGVRCGRREKPNEPLDLAETRYLHMPFADDASGVLMERFHIRQSLTFAVMDKAGRLRYRGGFDNNADEKRVTQSYLRNALRALAAGKPIAVKEGFALGCAILPVK